ncbi:MAG: transposase [Phycicoccus sp.]|nr:transposase [Phycicoccus sp.]
MSTIVDVTTGQVLGIVDGRGSAGVGAWLAARPAAWLGQVEVVAIDPSAAFRKAIRTHLPCAAVSVDTFHLVKLGNDAMTAVRQRLVREHKGRRGRLVDPATAAARRGHVVPGWVGTPGEGVPARRPDRRARRRVGDQGTAPPTVEDLVAGRRARGQDAPRALHPGRGHARNGPALGHDLRMVDRDRGPHRHGRHERANRGREHLDQDHQTHRTRLQKPR